jgi:hypothetical protein
MAVVDGVLGAGRFAEHAWTERTGELAWLQGTRGRALAARKRGVGLGEHHRLLQAVPREGRRCETRGKGEA